MKLKQSEIYSKFTKIVRQQTLDYKEQAKELEKLELSKSKLVLFMYRWKKKRNPDTYKYFKAADQ